MNSIPKNLASQQMFVALCEGLRWWFAFDGPQTVLIAKQNGRLASEDVRRIAIEYNFMRNLPADNKRLEKIGAQFRDFVPNGVHTLDRRAAELEPVIDEIFRLSGTKFRMVSGTTKLLWFAVPHRWTPYDRLASSAVRARFNSVRRMRDFYRRLDRIGFLNAADAIDRVLSETEFRQLRGTRVLDKFLMMRGDSAWTKNVRPFALAFAAALPPALREALVEAGTLLVEEPACQLDFGALE